MARGLIRLLGSLAGLVPLSAASAVGTYEGVLQTETSRSTIVLRCESPAACELEAKVVERGSPDYKSIVPITANEPDLQGARMALRFARAHRSLAATPEFAPFSHLRPLLDSDVDLSGCTATQSGNLVCELRSSPWDKPAVLYLAADLANCNDQRLFCAYVLLPLFQTSKVARVKPQVQARAEAKPRQPPLDITPPEKYRMVITQVPSNEELRAASKEAEQAYWRFHYHAFGEAYPLLLAQAERGEPIAQTALGIIYREGLGRPRDLEQALHWLRRADEKGSKWAAYAMAQIYDDGILLPRDITQAGRWYVKADAAWRARELQAPRADWALLFTAIHGRETWQAPRTWVAREQLNVYIYELYEKLGSAIKLPAGMRKGAGGYFDIGIAPDGSVTSVQQYLGWINDAGVAFDVLVTASTAITDGVKAASPLPMPPQWGDPVRTIRILYPPLPPQTR